MTQINKAKTAFFSDKNKSFSSVLRLAALHQN